MRMALALFMTLFSLWSWGQATESFTNIPTATTSSYLTRSWTGDNGLSWAATLARTDQTMTGKAICTNGDGTVTSPTVSGGIGVLTFNYVRAFTGTSPRTIGVYVNGTQIGGNISVSATSDVVQAYTSPAINISGNVVVELRTSGTQIKIDNVSWTGYSATTPNLQLTGTPVNHGTACFGSSVAPVTYTITNNGTVDAANVQITSDNAQFAISNYMPQTITANGGSATFNVTFTPSASGVQNAIISATSSTSGSNSPTLALTGTGTATVAGAVTTAAETNLGSTAVRLNGNVTTLGTCPATTEKGFVWGPNADPTILDLNTSVAGLTTGAYFYDLTGLTPNTTYHYRAYIKDANNVYTYGTDEVFTTLAVADHLAFVNVPTGGYVNTNLATFTVEARTALNAVDASYSGSVTISKASGTGAISGTITKAFENGVATFNDIKFDGIDTYSLYADHGTFAQITSGNIDIVAVPPFSMIEEFDYSTATNLNGQGGWTNHSGTAGQTKVTASSISYPGYLSSGIGNEVTLSSSNSEDLNKTFTSQTSGSLYASTLVNVSAASSGGDYFFHLGPNTMGTTFRGRVFVKSVTGGIQFGVSNAGGAVVYSSTVYDLNTTYLLVLKYDINSTALDAAKIYINPVLNATEPATGWIMSDDISQQPTIGSVALRQGGASTLKMDGIRISNNWAHIVGTVNTKWNGSVWTNGTPTSSLPAVIAGSYSGPAFESQSLTVNEGVTLMVNDYIKTGAVTNNGNIIVANNANFVQTGTFTAGPDSSFKVRKDSKAVKRQAYINWSSPMSGSAQTLKAFSYGKLADGVTSQSSTGTLDNRFYTYDNGVYVQVTNPSVATFSTPGAGYLIRTPNDFTTTAQIFHAQFEGKIPNSGTISYDHGNLIGGSYILLGNPYPGALSIEDFWAANPDTTGTVYIWDSGATMDINGNYAGNNYSTYSAAGANPAESIDGYIPTGQGFFVERTYMEPFVFTDSMRRGDQTGIFNRPAVQDRFWLEMASPSGAKPQMLIGFNAAAGTGYDKGYDAKMFSNNADVLYSKVDGQPLIIDAHGLFDETDTFNLNANFGATGTYTLGLLQKEGIFSTAQKIFLKDNATGILTDLTSGSYSFTAEAGLQENRFTIQFRTGVALGTETSLKESVVIFAVGKEIHVKANANISEVEVYEMSGKLIAVPHAAKKNAVFTVQYRGPVTVKVKLQNGTLQTKKLMLN